jgi:hypothetical protein
VTYFRDTLPVLSAVEDGPGYPTRVLSLEEKGFALAILESEDLAVAADVQLSLLQIPKSSVSKPGRSI